jgi:hypothetical protein
MISLQAGNSSSTLCNTITGTLVGRNCTLLCKLRVCSSLMIVNGAYKDFSFVNPKPLTGCIQRGISALFLKKIFIMSFKHIILYGKFYFYF